MRIPCAIHLDFFPPYGVRIRGNSDKLGILSVAILGLSENVRYKPEYIYTSIIGGPDGPKLEQTNGYLKPIIDEALVAWNRGIHFSSTGASPLTGRDADLAFVLSVNDLPAARQAAGLAHHSSHRFCSVCNCHGIPTMYRSDFDHPDWKPRDVNVLRKAAEAWRDATTVKERDAIFAEYGVRWSEFWRLPYWNPSRMLVIDSMHCVLEGLVHYECRHVLEINAETAETREKPAQAFTYEWLPYNEPDVPKDCRMHAGELKQLDALQRVLETSLTPLGLGGITEKDMRKKLSSRSNPPLAFLCWSLEIWPQVAGKVLKRDFVDKLMEWRKSMPLQDPDFEYRPKTVTPSDIDFIHKVIADTAVPSWLGSVPRDYGHASAGSIKADEWRILATVYLPIALILLWGDNTKGKQGAHFSQLLEHTMALFQATTIVCRYAMNPVRAAAYRTFLKTWVDNLHKIHPHTASHPHRPNVHVAFHIYDFLLLFGPIVSWWCFPFERLIGIIQRIKHNDQIGGEMETTILTSFMRGANLRRWLSREDCPAVIREFKRVFDRAFTTQTPADGTDTVPGRDREKAHFAYNGVNFSRASTHLGNSLVLFRPSGETTVVAGSIEKIEVVNGTPWFTIRRQEPLPSGAFDPFTPFPYFPATTYSSKMSTAQPDQVHPNSVLSHCARFEFSKNRAVILNLSRVCFSSSSLASS
ncbi:hypothetical protein DFH06DRAFT_977215 [Mycena polygramma]|nr:hypothetical protein DFH06DRAFT_977215 [Mycena polygramma]